MKWRDNRSQIVRGYSNVAVADDQEVVTRLAREAAEFVHLAARSKVRRADQQANRSSGKIGDQPADDLDRGIVVIGNGEDAKDISQLVFLKLWENIEKYDPTYAFDTWLYRMVTNVAIDFMRNKQSRDNAVNSNLRLVKTSTDAEQGVVVQRKEIENVFHAVSSVLSPKQKTIFVMSEMDDLRSSEIARILGCRESTVRNHLFNARKLMQQQLKKRFPEYSRLWEEKQ